MIVDVNEVTLASIRNPTLRCYAEQYVRIYQDFMQQVRDMGIEVEEADDGELFVGGLLCSAGRVRLSVMMARACTLIAFPRVVKLAKQAWVA